MGPRWCVCVCVYDAGRVLFPARVQSFEIYTDAAIYASLCVYMLAECRQQPGGNSSRPFAVLRRRTSKTTQKGKG